MAVMYCHRKILTKDEIAKYPLGVLNIHNSILPYNRGAHPNFWSWYDDTAKGVTIHRVDEGLDTGPILASQVIHFGVNNTLKTSYDILHEAALRLFRKTWPYLRNSDSKGAAQNHERATLHKKRDLEAVWPLLSCGWDTPVSEVMELGRLDHGKIINGLVEKRG